MAIPRQCTFKKEFLAHARILYVEDEDIVREEAAEIFLGLFKEVFVANNGEDGLAIYKENKGKIDIILTDINMPKLSGLDMLAHIREIDWDVPVLITTGFSDPDILIKAIKYNVTNYIIKPMQLNTTFKIISNIMEEKDREKKLKIQENELQQFMSILDSQNLVCEFDLDGNILSANDLYIAAAGYTIDEILKLKHEKLNHANFAKNMYESIIEDMKKGHTHTCECKKISKTGMVFFTHSTFLPIYSISGKIKKFIEFGTLTTKYEKEILTLKKSILSLKSESFKSNLDHKNEQSQVEKITAQFQKKLDDSINGNQQLLMELYELKKQKQELEDKMKEQEKRFEEYQAQQILC